MKIKGQEEHEDIKAGRREAGRRDVLFHRNLRCSVIVSFEAFGIISLSLDYNVWRFLVCKCYPNWLLSSSFPQKPDDTFVCLICFIHLFPPKFLNRGHHHLCVNIVKYYPPMFHFPCASSSIHQTKQIHKQLCNYVYL